MKYYTVTADYNGTGLKDDFDGQIEPSSLGIPSPILVQLSNWVAQYQSIIPLNTQERHARRQQIERLDAEGLAIAGALELVFSGSAKVGYYSEGLLRKLI